MIPVIMPQVGQDLPAGTIVRWLKRENEAVEKGETILEVESEKATFEIEAEKDGVLLKIVHQEGSVVEILQPVGYIGQPGEFFDGESIPSDVSAAPAEPIVKVGNQGQIVHPPDATYPKSILASPSVRRLAREKGVDLIHVAGSGPNGRIIREDVLAAATDDVPTCPQQV